MKIFITIPSFARHGGVRIIGEWSNRLCEWHDVYLHCLSGEIKWDWFALNPKIKLMDADMSGMDCLIITSPHSIHFQNRPDAPKKIFIFAQMAEHLFNPDQQWKKKCLELYTSKHPMFSISEWNIEEFKKLGRKGITHYIGNGVNTEDFPIERPEKDGKTILIEGWEAYNQAKDIDKLAPKVAQRLKKEGYKIIAYSQFPLKTLPGIPDEYYYNPDLKTMNDLYRRATILIKASRYDARSCSPCEAMSKGCVTVRAIIKGDDDLIHEHNCLKVGYNINQLYEATKRILKDEHLRLRLQEQCYKHIEEYSWDYWMEKINKILCKD